MAKKKGSTAEPKYKPLEKTIGPVSKYLGAKPGASFGGKSQWEKKK